MKRFAATLAIVIALVSVTGCALFKERPIINPDITGVITSLAPSGAGVSIRVVHDASLGSTATGTLDVVQVTVPGSLAIEDGTSSSGKALAAADLRIGDIVAVYLEGALAESYPPQGTAKMVTYLGKHEGELPKVPGLEPPTPSVGASTAP